MLASAVAWGRLLVRLHVFGFFPQTRNTHVRLTGGSHSPLTTSVCVCVCVESGAECDIVAPPPSGLNHEDLELRLAWMWT